MNALECQFCGADIDNRQCGANAKYCGPECRKSAQRLVDEGKPLVGDSFANADTTIDRVCNTCGKPFSVFRLAGEIIHPACLPQKCEDCKCGRRYKACLCKVCNKWFDAPVRQGPPPPCCSDECKRVLVNSQQRRLKARERQAKPCSICGQPVQHGSSKLCSTCKEKRRTGTFDNTCCDCGSHFQSRTPLAKRCIPCAGIAEKNRLREAFHSRAREGACVAKTANTGTTGELLFDLACIRSDLDCTRPTRDNQPNWDRVVVVGRRAIRVQIRSMTNPKDGVWRWRKRERPISVSQVDVIAVVDVTSANLFIFNAEQIAPTTTFDPKESQHARASVFDGDGLERLLLACANEVVTGGT